MTDDSNSPIVLDVSKMDLESVFVGFSLRVGANAYLDHASNLLFVNDNTRLGETDRNHSRFFVKYWDADVPSNRELLVSILLDRLPIASGHGATLVFRVSRSTFEKDLTNQHRSKRVSTIVERMGGAEALFAYTIEAWKICGSYLVDDGPPAEIEVLL